MSPVYVHQFKEYVPPYKITQNQSLDWLSHFYAQSKTNQTYTQPEYLKLLNRVGCSEDQVHSRFSFLKDYVNTDFSQNTIFNLKTKKGEGALARNLFYQESAEKVFTEIYRQRDFPTDLIHVSCTGYVSPSAAQLKAIASGKNITVTHSYHMGCYGAFPAVRMATGFLSAQNILGAKKSVDVVHTELCSLHLNPEDPTLEQMVIQSLFSDGCIAYRLQTDLPQKGFELLSVREIQIPDSAEAMAWIVSDWGMKMVLSKDVPSIVSKNIVGYLQNWLSELGLSLADLQKDAVFAIHPGGPKIIQQISQILELKSEQYFHSQNILKNRGNMSSATLPHVWQSIAEDQSVQAGTKIVSMAFGPGLTVCLSLMKKL